MDKSRKQILHTIEEWDNHYYSELSAQEGWALVELDPGRYTIKITDQAIVNKTWYDFLDHMVDMWNQEYDMMYYSALNIVKYTNPQTWRDICNITNVDTIWRDYDGSPYVVYVIMEDDLDTVARIMGTDTRIYLDSSIKYRSGYNQFLRLSGYSEVKVLKDNRVSEIEQPIHMEVKYHRMEHLNSMTSKEDVVEVTGLYVNRVSVKYDHGKLKTLAHIYCFLGDGRKYTVQIPH